VNGDEIRAYVLLGCLVAAYPVMLGVKAIEKAVGPEIVVFDGCRYEVKDYGSYKEGEPLDAEAKACIAKHEKEYAENAVFNYQQAHDKHRRPDQ
jgi:hypothetical protein